MQVSWRAANSRSPSTAIALLPETGSKRERARVDYVLAPFPIRFACQSPFATCQAAYRKAYTLTYRGRSEDLHSLFKFTLTRANRSPSAHVVLQAVTRSSAFIESTRFSSAAQAQTCWPLASHVCVLERASEITIAEHQAVQHVGDLRANTHAKKAMCGGARRRCSANCRHSCCRRRSGLARCRLARGRAERGKACAPND